MTSLRWRKDAWPEIARAREPQTYSERRAERDGILEKGAG
jgi:hypothetical protein